MLRQRHAHPCTAIGRNLHVITEIAEQSAWCFAPDIELQGHSAAEAILIRDGVVTEGSHSNVFAVLDGELRTYPRCNYILPGITRANVLELAAELGIPASETPLLEEEVRHAEEIFVTAITTDVMPIVRVNGAPVGSAEPGPETRALQGAHTNRLAGMISLA